MGHSTGTQDIMAYLLPEAARAPLDGAILQAPVSDREAFAEPAHVQAGKIAQDMVNNGKGEDLIPEEHAKAFGFPGVELRYLTAYRCWSLVCSGWVELPASSGAATRLMASRISGDDDFFSSDLPNNADSGSPVSVHIPMAFGLLTCTLRQHRPLSDTFGRLPTDLPLLFLMSGADQYVPSNVDKQALLERWRASCASGVQFDGQVLAGADHAVGNDTSREQLLDIVKQFLQRIPVEKHSQL